MLNSYFERSKEMSLISAAVEFGNWLKLQPECSLTTAAAISTAQRALESFPNDSGNRFLDYGIEITLRGDAQNSSRPHRIVRSWGVYQNYKVDPTFSAEIEIGSLFTTVFADLENDPHASPFNDGDILQEDWFFLRSDRPPLPDKNFERWINDVRSLETLRSRALEIDIEASVEAKLIRS